MGLKNAFRKLACRPAKDEENQLAVDLVEAEIEDPQEDIAKQQPKRRATKNKRRNNESKINGSRYMLELRQRDPYSIKEVTGKHIDILATFAPQPKWWMTAIKLIIFTWITFVFVDGFFQQSPKSFYMATFDHWSNVVTIAYLWFSFLVNFQRPSSKSIDFFSPQRNVPSMLQRITWTLFAIAAPSQLLTSLEFWIFEFNGDDLDGGLVNYFSVIVLLLIEGLCLNRTPLRVNHQWFFMAFVYTFLVWSLVHSYLEIGNPNTGEDAIYPFLDWNASPIATALYVVIILLIVVPFVYWIVWMMSLFAFPWSFWGKGRRYLNKERSRMMESYFEDMN